MTLSRTHHPDKGGDEQKFKEISAAYQILSDEEKKGPVRPVWPGGCVRRQRQVG